MIHGIVTRAEALESGISPSRITKLLQSKQWTRLHPGVFLTQSPDDVREKWLAELAGMIRWCDGDAAVSHRAAARLHGLDGIDDWAVDVTVPWESHARHNDLIRSRTYLPATTAIEGLPVTSVARTLRDLGRFYQTDVVEQAIESALRGTNRMRPDHWNRALLGELREAALEHGPGLFVFRKALARRTDEDRATGSRPETLILQALRRCSVEVVRQPDVCLQRPGQRDDTFFPDFGVAGYRLLLDVEGLIAHGSATQLRRDANRQNRLLPGFRMMRLAAIDIMADADAVAAQVVARMRSLPEVGSQWREDGVTVCFNGQASFTVRSTS